jgi:transposase
MKRLDLHGFVVAGSPTGSHINVLIVWRRAHTGRPAMDIIGIDLHKRESQLCVLQTDGTMTEQRIVTSRERFAAIFGAGAPARILLEASTESEWVAQCLEGFGHEVIVADPNYAPMYATRSRRVKTDKRDARTLAEALKLGAFRPAHRVSAARRHVRAELAVREALVRTRTRYIAIAKAFVRRDGLRVPSSESHLVAKRVAALTIPAVLEAELAPLFAVLEPLNAQIAAADRRITALTRADPIVALLATAPSIGPLTASAVVSTIDDITRFSSAHHFEAFLGLVPGERSSGEKRRVGRITKAGNSRARYLLVEAGWRILRSKSVETAALRAWALKIAGRRGKRIAVVAVARRLAGILYAMWRDGAAYDAGKLRGPQTPMAQAS